MTTFLLWVAGWLVVVVWIWALAHVGARGPAQHPDKGASNGGRVPVKLPRPGHLRAARRLWLVK